MRVGTLAKSNQSATMTTTRRKKTPSWMNMSLRGILLASCVAASAASAVVSKSIQSLSKRRLEDNPYFQYDLSDFSLRFDKCQDVRMYDDDLAEDGDSDSPLALNHFVLFRLCPSESCDECDTVYGKYVLDLETYLDATVRFQKESFEASCQNCQNCNEDDGCSECNSLCQEYENLENLGYVDASDYIECQALGGEGQGDDDGSQVYIGPLCSSGRITIGLFSDESCSVPVEDVDVEGALGASLWTNFIMHSSGWRSDPSCLSCMEQDEDGNDNDNNDADNVNEMCEDVYNAAAKCESKTGLSTGFIQTNKDEGQYENQVQTEFMSCTFIDSLRWNSYTETGEINVKSTQDEVIRQVTAKQAYSLTLVAFMGLCLVGLMEYYRRKIEKVSPPVQLYGNAEHSMT